MAERFYGPHNKTVAFGNECVGDLIHEWLRLCQEMPASDMRDKVAGFFQSQLNLPGEDKSFSFRPLPDVLQDKRNLRFFGQLLVMFIQELAQEHETFTVGSLTLDREWQVSWVARMLDLLEIVNDCLGSPVERIVAGELTLSSEDETACQYERLRWKRIHYEKYDPDPKPEKILAMIDSMLQIQLMYPQPRVAQIALLYQDSAEILANTGELAAAAQALTNAMKYEQNEDMRGIIQEWIDELKVGAEQQAEAAKL